MSIFQDPQFAPLEQIFMQIMLVYKNLEKTAKKLAKSISYNDNNSSQGQLPPNLRLILVSQTWPQGLDREACQKLDKEEQLLWNDTLQKIFLQRQNFLRNSYNEYKKHIGKYSEPDSLREIIVTEHPETEAHPNAIKFLAEHFTDTANNLHTTNMDEEMTTSSSTSSSSSSATTSATTSTIVTDLTDTATTRELISMVTSLTADLKDLKKTFGAGKNGLKSPPTSVPARDKLPKQAKRAFPQPFPAQHPYGPTQVQQPYGYPQFQQNHPGQATPYPVQPSHYPVQPSPYPVQPYPVQPYPYHPMNGQYTNFPNYSPPPPQHPPHFFTPTRDTDTVNPTVTVNRGSAKNTKVRFLKN